MSDNDMFSVNDILNPQFLSDAYKEVADGMLKDPLTDFFMGGATENDGDPIEMVYYSAVKTTAPLNVRGAPAKTLDAAGASKKYFSPYHSFNEKSWPLASVEFLRQDNNPALQDKGRQEIARQMEIFAYQQAQMKRAILAKTLGDGIVYFDSSYQVLEDSSGANTAYTVDLGVPANNKNQLNSTINTRWDQASANILQDLDQLRIASIAANAEPPKHIWLNSTWKQYFRANTELKSFIVLNAPWAQKTLDGYGDTMQLDDFVFHFYDGTYIGADGSTTRKFIGDTKAIITPEPGPWLRKYSCPELIPTQEGIFTSVEEALNSTTKVYGDYAYAAITKNPAKFSVFMGFNFFVGFANPKAVYCAVIGT